MTRSIEIQARNATDTVTYRLRRLSQAKKIGNYEWSVSWPGHTITNPTAYDMLEIGKAIHLSDRAVRRSLRYGRRTREIHLSIPVLQPSLWRPAAPLLESLARFASADIWKIEFAPVAGHDYTKSPKVVPKTGVVALFSGGLDSLCGAAYLAKIRAQPIFVTHSPPGRDSSVSLLQDVWRAFGRKELDAESFATFRLRGRERNRKGARSMFQEPTRRTRPFFFLTLACAVALESGVSTIQMSENGAFALSLPIRADAHGALCSRQAHANLLFGFQGLLQTVAPWLGDVRIVNPFAELTKGEECARYLGNAATLVHRAVSCEYVGRQAAFLRAWKKKHATLVSQFALGAGPQCGVCLPCLVRRAALYKNRGQVSDADGLYFFDARRVRDRDPDAQTHTGYVFSKKRGGRPPLYDAAAAHVYHVRQFCARVLRMDKSSFATQYLPELRLPQVPEFYSDEAVERHYGLVRRFAKELLQFLDAR